MKATKANNYTLGVTTVRIGGSSGRHCHNDGYHICSGCLGGDRGNSLVGDAQKARRAFGVCATGSRWVRGGRHMVRTGRNHAISRHGRMGCVGSGQIDRGRIYGIGWSRRTLADPPQRRFPGSNGRDSEDGGYAGPALNPKIDGWTPKESAAWERESSQRETTALGRFGSCRYRGRSGRGFCGRSCSSTVSAGPKMGTGSIRG